MRSLRNLFIAALLGSLFCTAQAQADVILSNLPGTPSGTGTNLGLGTDGADRTKAVGITMLATPYFFDSMVALMDNPDTVARTLTGGIFSSVGGNPGVSLASFTPVSVPAGTNSTTFTLTTPATFTLTPNTTFWFVLDGPSVANGLLWETLTPNTQPTPNGVTFASYRFSSNGGTTWAASTTANGVTINATIVPEPAALSLLAAAACALTLRRRN